MPSRVLRLGSALIALLSFCPRASAMCAQEAFGVEGRDQLPHEAQDYLRNNSDSLNDLALSADHGDRFDAPPLGEREVELRISQDVAKRRMFFNKAKGIWVILSPPGSGATTPPMENQVTAAPPQPPKAVPEPMPAPRVVPAAPPRSQSHSRNWKGEGQTRASKVAELISVSRDRYPNAKITTPESRDRNWFEKFLSEIASAANLPRPEVELALGIGEGKELPRRSEFRRLIQEIQHLDGSVRNRVESRHARAKALLEPWRNQAPDLMIKETDDAQIVQKKVADLILRGNGRKVRFTKRPIELLRKQYSDALGLDRKWTRRKARIRIRALVNDTSGGRMRGDRIFNAFLDVIDQCTPTRQQAPSQPQPSAARAPRRPRAQARNDQALSTYRDQLRQTAETMQLMTDRSPIVRWNAIVEGLRPVDIDRELPLERDKPEDWEFMIEALSEKWGNIGSAKIYESLGSREKPGAQFLNSVQLNVERVVAEIEYLLQYPPMDQVKVMDELQRHAREAGIQTAPLTKNTQQERTKEYLGKLCHALGISWPEVIQEAEKIDLKAKTLLLRHAPTSPAYGYGSRALDRVVRVLNKRIDQHVRNK